MKVLLATFVLILVCVGGKTVLSVDPLADCPEYVVEGQRLYCECRAINVQNTLPKASWPGKSDTYQLLVENVTRLHNGTSYTCRVTAGNETKSTIYVMQVAYGPTDNTTKIVGPQSFVTDGTRNLTLTCQATEVYPIPSYSWSGVFCDEGNLNSKCTFRPIAPGDDGKMISCTATNRVIGIPNAISGTTIFPVDLNYPPSETPVITGYTTGQILKSGDIVTCTISGGKPLVSAVIFQCSNPDLPDHTDIKFEVTSMTSNVIVDTSQAKDGAPVCICRGVWEPERDLYTKSKIVTIETEYKASVVRFSINGSSDVITVNENDASDVSLVCATQGRPSPKITLTRSGDAIPLRQVNQTVELSFRMSRITCEKMGQYACTADNGYPSPSRMSARLIVKCAPRHAQSDFAAANSQTPPKMTAYGLNLTFISYPTPSTFLYTFHQNHSGNPGSAVSRNLFATACGQSADGEYVAACEVRVAGEVKEEDFGVYGVQLANGMGSLDYYFNLDMTVVARPATSTDVGGSEVGTSIAAIAGGAAAGGVLIIAVVAGLLVFVVKGKKTEQGGSNEEQRKSGEDDPVIEEHENVAYVSADDVDKNSNQSSLRKKSPDAVPLSSGRSASGYDYVSGYVPEQKRETETDFGYASVKAGNLETGLSVGNGEAQRPVSDMYESVNEGHNTSPANKSSQEVEYAVVDIANENSFQSQPASQTNEYSDIDAKSPRDNAGMSDSDVNAGHHDTTVGPLGDVYTTVDRASKKKNQFSFQVSPTTMPHAKDTTIGPLGDVYARVHKAPRDGNPGADRDNQKPIPKPKRHAKPKPGSGLQFSQSGAATEIVKDKNAGASFEDMSPGVSLKVPAELYEEVALASSSTKLLPQVANNGVGECEYNRLNFSERDPTTSSDPNAQYSHIRVS